MGVTFGDPDQLASPLSESAVRVRDDGAVIIFYLSHTIGQGLATYESAILATSYQK